MGSYIYHDTPIGKIRLRSSEEGLCALDHVNQQDSLAAGYVLNPECPFLRQAQVELDEYFVGERESFETRLSPIGTSFQRQVWEALTGIPFGQTASYSEIAEMIGNPKSVRAVGAANGKNPLSIFIPCHRVIGKSGKLVGYAGGLAVKQTLLRVERLEFNY